MSGKHPLVQAVENVQLKQDILSLLLATLLSFR